MASVPVAFQRYAASGGVSLGRPILLLHGVFGSKNNWKSMAKKLAVELRRNVFALDARNHGRSPHTCDMSYELMSNDTEEFIRKNLGGESSVIIGHSMGGKTAMTLSLTFPHLVDKLVVVDVAPIKTQSLGNMMQYLQALSSINLKELRSRSQANAMLESVIADDKIRNFLLTNLRKNDDNTSFHWSFNLTAINECIETINQFPADLKYQTYDGPTLFVGGSKSEYINPSIYGDIKSLFPAAHIKHIEGAGHWVHADKPVDLLHIIKDFLD